jgi:hypothetical protein
MPSKETWNTRFNLLHALGVLGPLFGPVTSVLAFAGMAKAGRLMAIEASEDQKNKVQTLQRTGGSRSFSQSDTSMSITNASNNTSVVYVLEQIDSTLASLITDDFSALIITKAAENWFLWSNNLFRVAPIVWIAENGTTITSPTESQAAFVLAAMAAASDKDFIPYIGPEIIARQILDNGTRRFVASTRFDYTKLLHMFYQKIAGVEVDSGVLPEFHLGVCLWTGDNGTTVTLGRDSDITYYTKPRTYLI